MSSKKLEALERRFAREWKKGKAAALAVIDETCATNLVFHSGTGEDIKGIKGFKKFVSEIFKAFPDNNLTIDDMIVEGDKVALCYTFTGTHMDEYRGVRQTNKKVKIWVLEVDRIVDGKFVESWLRFDTIDLMHQLGLMRPPASILQP